MPFQRSYSKVWWGSDNQLPSMTANSNRFNGSNFYSFYSQQSQQRQKQQQPQSIPQQEQQQQKQQFDFKIGNSDGTSHQHHHHHLVALLEIDGNNFRSFPGNLSRIQEVEDEQNASKLSWEKRDSPGSLRSQDSGFSDNEESHGTRKALGGSGIDADAIADSTPASSTPKTTQSFDSPTSLRDERVAETPPTVIRRVGKSEFYSSLVNVSRRISFSGSPASSDRTINEGKRKLEQQNGIKDPARDKDEKGDAEEENVESSRLMKELDRMHLVDDEVTGDFDKTFKVAKQTAKARRRRRLSRRPVVALSFLRRRCNSTNNSSEEEEEDEDSKDYSGDPGRNVIRRSRSLDDLETEYNSENTACIAYTNRKIYLDESPPPYNNETVILDGTTMTPYINNNNNNDFSSPLKQQHPLSSTSTPKFGRKLRNTPIIPKASLAPAVPLFHFERPLLNLNYQEYSNPLLNGHDPALQSWIGSLRTSYEHEVMSTLQTKSIAAEAFKNFTITTNTVTKIIRQLQQRAQHLQINFEAMERILKGEQAASLAEAFDGATLLVNQVEEFSQVLQRRAVFFNESPKDRSRYEQSLERIKLTVKDTRISLEKHHYINLESLLEDLLVLKRNLLVALRLVFEKLVRVIVQSIEHSRCDLMLRANINMIATLTNVDYDGFASLTDAFVQNEAVRSLLIVCLDHRVSSVRALALRALATICCAPTAIEQLGACGGVEILRDILQVKEESDPINENESEVSSCRVTDVERREAVSLLTQITAVWHGADHRVDGLRDSAETIIEGMTALMTRTRCPQTLLLCAASMNNLSRIEVTSHYSIMSNEAISKWIEIVQEQQEIQEDNQPTTFESVSVFLYEQLVTMLYNMSLNKKCHSHLANGIVINFISSVYHVEFYRVYESRAQRDSQRRTIKAILHTLTRLVQESTLGPELLELQGIPVLLRTTLASVSASNARNESVRPTHDHNLARGRVPLLQQKQEQHTGIIHEVATLPTVENSNVCDDGHKLQLLLRQESYV